MNPWAGLTEAAPRPSGGAIAYRNLTDLSARAVCAVKLLRLGPLGWNEFLAITGWPWETLAKVLEELKHSGIAHRASGEWRLSA